MGIVHLIIIKHMPTLIQFILVTFESPGKVNTDRYAFLLIQITNKLCNGEDFGGYAL